MNARQHKPVWSNPYIPWDKHSEDAQEIIRHAWLTGQLSYKLSPAQRAVYDEIRAWEQSKNRLGRTFILDIGRRFGKSSIMVLIAFEDAFRNAGWRIPYYSTTHKDLMRFIEEHLQKILSDCPPDLRPVWTSKDSTYRLPHNGSKIEMIGLDVNPDGARGGSFDKALLDESAFFDNLETIMQSVLQPQMMGRPHARIIAGSTPPVSPSHYWTQAMIPCAIAEKAILTRTIDDADIYPESEKEEFIAKLGGRRDVRCRRELFTEHVTDETLAIIPEFRDVEAEITREVVAPMWRDCWVAMDPGWKDHTAVLFGYWHFADSCLVLEDEISAPRLHSAIIAEQIRQKETVLWTGITCRTRNGLRTPREHINAARPQPFMRVSDNDARLLYDLQVDHGLAFSVTAKDNLDQQINSLRNAIAGKRIVIHPRCTMTRKQLRNGVWKNEVRKVFAREGGDLGHFDLIAALVYLWRGVSQYRTRNPAPIAEKYIAGDLKAKHENDQQGSKWQRRNGRIWFKAQRSFPSEQNRR